MLGLFKESERQTKLKEEAVQRQRDLAMQESFQKLNNEGALNRSLLRGEKNRMDLKKATQASRDMLCKQNIMLCEESLGRELGDKKLQVQREEKVRQLLWANAPELKDLRKMVLTADVARDQAMQLAEKRVLRQLEREEEKSIADMAAKEWAELEAAAKRKEAEEMMAKRDYHKQLDELRRFKKAQDTSDQSQLESEIAAIDEIKKQIEEEDLKQARDKIEKQRELRRQMEDLQKTRADMELQKKLTEYSESLKDDEYRKAQELRAKEQEEKKQLELEQRLLLQEELLDCLERTCREKLQKEQLRTDLAIEERDIEDRQRSLGEELKRKRICEDLQKVYDMQLYVKKQKEDLLKKEEELFRQNLMTKLYEEDKLEQMGHQRRRQKQIEHKRAVEEMLKESRLKKAAEKAREMADIKYQEQMEAERARMVNEERIRFLREHAKELLGYLPKGILQDTQTVEKLGDDFKNFYFRQGCKD